MKNIFEIRNKFEYLPEPDLEIEIINQINCNQEIINDIKEVFTIKPKKSGKKKSKPDKDINMKKEAFTN